LYAFKITEMENELNYLSEKIEELTQDRDWNEREIVKRDHSKMRSDMMERVDRLNTEIELLENILNVVTEQALT
jgi:prefoldin subunit 5